MKTDNWGKFTVRGTAKVEVLITEMIERIASAFEDNLQNIDYEALIMLGGYGRGEGGVVIENGIEKPHNNFDFILISKNLDDKQNEKLKQKLMVVLNVIIKEIGIGIDLSVISKNKLKNASCRIIWYDMRFGHKTILGNEKFVPALERFTIPKIPDWDARNLLVNRGTLMIINDLLMEKEHLDERFLKLVIKHVVKAIIGYGDTLLYFLDDYSWSYEQKQKNMRKRDDVDIEFKEIYEEAMNFRFQPDYPGFMKKDLKNWMEILRKHFEKIFLICESKRLKKADLNWDNYAESAFNFGLTDQMFQAKPLAKKIINIIKNSSSLDSGNFRTKLGFKSLGDAGIVPILFPLFAYKLENKKYLRLTADFLSTDIDFPKMRRAYLRYWGDLADANLINTLTKYEISLEEK